MKKENRGQEDDLKLQGKRKPTNLEARLEEARALRKKALAEREQGMNGANEGHKNDAPESLADETPNATSPSASQSAFAHQRAPSSEALGTIGVEDQPATPLMGIDRRNSRVAERLALGLGIGLGIGASFYLGASLFGERIGFVSADATNSAAQPKQVALDNSSVETNDIVSPTYVSQVEPEALKTNIPSEKQAANTPTQDPDAVSSNYEMAPENVNAEGAAKPQPSPEEALPVQVLEASLNADEPDVDPSVLSETSASAVQDTAVIGSDETLDKQYEPAPLPEQEVAKEVLTDPIIAAIAEAGVDEELAEEPTVEAAASLPAEPDQRLPGAEAFAVVLNAPKSLSDEEVTRVSEDIVGTGASIDKVERVNYLISANQVRFFRVDDAAPAAAIAERIGAEARDFTDYRPTPPAGTIEMFLASDGGKHVETPIVAIPVAEELAPEKRAARLYPANDDR